MICWILTTLALLPLFPLWKSNEHGQCGFLTVVSKSYLYFRHVLFTIIPCIGLFFISLAVIHQIREVRLKWNVLFVNNFYSFSLIGENFLRAF